MKVASIVFKVGDRFIIPQWEHTRHNGFAEVVAIGKGYRTGKVLIRYPDLSEAWGSIARIKRLFRGFASRGRGRPRNILDFWVIGEQEYVYARNLERLRRRGGKR